MTSIPKYPTILPLWQYKYLSFTKFPLFLQICFANHEIKHLLIVNGGLDKDACQWKRMLCRRLAQSRPIRLKTGSANANACFKITHRFSFVTKQTHNLNTQQTTWARDPVPDQPHTLCVLPVSFPWMYTRVARNQLQGCPRPPSPNTTQQSEIRNLPVLAMAKNPTNPEQRLAISVWISHWKQKKPNAQNT